MSLLRLARSASVAGVRYGCGTGIHGRGIVSCSVSSSLRLRKALYPIHPWEMPPKTPTRIAPTNKEHLGHSALLAHPEPLQNGIFPRLIGALGIGSLVAWAVFVCSGDNTGKGDPEHIADAEGVVTFGNARASFEAKSTWELFRAICIIKTCRIKPLIDNLDEILDWIDRFKLTPLSHLFMKYTFYRHFCAGADHTQALTVVTHLDGAGVGSVIDLSVEDDPTPGSDPDVFFDDVSRRIKEGIDVASAFSGNFVAVKVTALTSYRALHHLSDVYFQLRNNMNEEASRSGDASRMTWNSFARVLNSVREPGDELTSQQLREIEGALEKYITKGGYLWGEATIAWEDALNATALDTPAARHIYAGAKAPHHHDLAVKYNPQRLTTTIDTLTADEYNTVVKAVHRLADICHYAKTKRVRVMLDQEYYEIKPSLDLVAWTLSKQFNRAAHDKGSDDKGPLVYNTYQCYLKESVRRVEQDLARYKKEGIMFGAKIVRGAYMTFERKRAAVYNLPSPINDTKNDTDISYNKVIDHLLENGLKTAEDVNNRHVCFMVATHNEHSVARAVATMHKNNIAPDKGVVHFGQLLGMCDHVSFMLGTRGYDVLKYCPFGEVEEVMPYLIRRARENSDILGGTQHEVELLTKELRRRLTPW